MQCALLGIETRFSGDCMLLQASFSFPLSGCFSWESTHGLQLSCRDYSLLQLSWAIRYEPSVCFRFLSLSVSGLSAETDKVCSPIYNASRFLPTIGFSGALSVSYTEGFCWKTLTRARMPSFKIDSKDRPYFLII
jgi:hypothetical protein